jgi:hypothetical protein
MPPYRTIPSNEEPSKSGIKTPKQNIDLIKERLKKAQEIAKEQQ